MRTESLVAIIGAISAFMIGGGGLLRQMTGDRFKRRVDESAHILSGWHDQVQDLNGQLDAIQARHAAEMQRLTSQHHVEMQAMRSLHDAERDRWQADRDRLEERIDTLEGQVTALLHR